MTPRQFRRRFRTESDCLRYVIKRKWPDGFHCPRCEHDQAWLIPSRRKYQCKGCWHQTTVTANTIFHKIRKPLRDWFWAIYLMAIRIPPRRDTLHLRQSRPVNNPDYYINMSLFGVSAAPSV
jgi:transposase-like protein